MEENFSLYGRKEREAQKVPDSHSNKIAAGTLDDDIIEKNAKVTEGVWFEMLSPAAQDVPSTFN